MACKGVEHSRTANPIAANPVSVDVEDPPVQSVKAGTT
jgi:hypothetical protein